MIAFLSTKLDLNRECRKTTNASQRPAPQSEYDIINLFVSGTHTKKIVS